MRIDRTQLAAAEHLRIPALRTAGRAQQGEHRSPQLGAGLEVVDYRPYQEGDDLRRVDWNAYLRLESLHIRLSPLERAQRILIAVDATGSMSLDGKADHAAMLAVGLAMAGLQGRDEVRLGCFGADLPAALHTGHDLRDLPKMMGLLTGREAGGSGDALAALRAWSGGKRLERAILLSDLLVPPEEAERTLAALAGCAQRPTLLHVLGQGDLRPDLVGSQEWEDAETGERLILSGDAQTVAAYQQALADWQQALARQCAQHGIQLLAAHTPIALATLWGSTLRRAGLLTTRARGGR